MPTQALKEAAVEFLTLVGAGKVGEAYDRFVTPGFRHHNPYFRGDAPSLRAGMEKNAAENPNKVLEVLFALQEGDRVAVLSHVKLRPGDPGLALVHIFRFEDGLVAELWDIGQAVPKDSVNENGMF